VADAGEYAVRGSIFDIFPSGLDQGLRLDFFGDEIETIRLFDPATQRTTGTLPQHLLLPASEALLDDDSIKRFRTAIARNSRPMPPPIRSIRRCRMGAVWRAWSIGCRCSKTVWSRSSTIWASMT
jgi:transcription-repair coupling factor (superfamily II helicase)